MLPTAAPAEWVGLPKGFGRVVRSSLGRAMHTAWHLGERITGSAISPSINATAIENAFLEKGKLPPLATIDNFLTPEALRRVREYCMASTVWFEAKERLLGAYLDEGFAAPILLQIAEELPQKFPRIFGDHRLAYLWAYKYQADVPGIGIHADEAAINVNFWITPDSANLGRAPHASAGLVVYDALAPPGWDASWFNAYGNNKQRINDLLQSTGWANRTVAYRQNRMVMFTSDLFHKTDSFQFRNQYESRRINLTLLYGPRAQGRVVGK